MSECTLHGPPLPVLELASSSPPPCGNRKSDYPTKPLKHKRKQAGVKVPSVWNSVLAWEKATPIRTG